MGTNYYLEKNKCKCCGRTYEPLHIGKSNAGWNFSLRIVPENKIFNLKSWQALWEQPEYTILNEYREKISPDEMTDIITKRSCYGENKLLAHTYKAKRTGGTYDLINYDFY